MFVAELGDRTFLMTMIEVASLGACATLSTAIITLCGMHVLASLLGWGISYVINGWWVKLICTILFIVIGLVTLIVECYKGNKSAVDESVGSTPSHSKTTNYSAK